MSIRKTRTSKRWMVVVAATTLCASAVAVASSASATTPVTSERFSGANRYGTAADVSDELDVCTVMVANGLDYPDGLVASSWGYPVLLVTQSSIPAETLAELTRLAGPAPLSTFCGNGDLDVYVVGGPAAVSSAVFEQLKAFTDDDGSIRRLSGDDRYGTALKVGQFYDDEWCTITTYSDCAVVLATGENFPDALAAGPLAYEYGLLLLNNGNKVRADVGAFLVANKIASVFIVGGTAAVPQSVENDLWTTYGIDAVRLAGANRSETAAKIAAQLVTHDTVYNTGVVLVNQHGFADALAAGPLASAYGYPILMVDVNGIPAATAAWHAANYTTIIEVLAVGGTSVISDATLAAAVAATKPMPVKVSSATFQVSDQKAAVFKIDGDVLKLTAKGAALGSAANIWDIKLMSTGDTSKHGIVVDTTTTPTTPMVIMTNNFAGMTYSSFVSLWNSGAAKNLFDASTTTGAATFSIASGDDELFAAPTTLGSQDYTVVVTFPVQILTPCADSTTLTGTADGIYLAGGIAPAAPDGLAENACLFDSVAKNKVTVGYGDKTTAPPLAVDGAMEFRFANITGTGTGAGISGPASAKLTNP